MYDNYDWLIIYTIFTLYTLRWMNMCMGIYFGMKYMLHPPYNQYKFQCLI